jgi:ATP-dependent exoDNAse (exonuclease V) alpha subunit
LDEIGYFEKRALRAVMVQAQGQKIEVTERVTASEAIRHSVDHAFARQSVAAEHELLEAALVKGCGQLELAALKRALRHDERLVRVGEEYSTREILQSELWMIRHVNRGLGVAEPIAPKHRVTETLGVDQRAALKLVLSSSDRITGMQGLAGAGKTTTLRELEAAVKQSGRELIVCAPSAAATDVLRKEGFSEAVTVAKLLTDPVRLSSRSVLVVDEAGTLGVRDMIKVFEKAIAARVVLVGDTGQHAPVAQGDALRILEEHSGFRFGQLTEIRRQKTETLRETVSLAAKRQTKEAYARLLKAGEVVEQNDIAALHQKAADDYLRVTESGKTALVVSPTWAEIAAVTEAIRAKRREQKQLAIKEEKVRVFDPVGWTDAQKKLVAHYEPGLQLRFVKRSGEFKAGETVEVAAQRGRQLVVRGSDQRERLFFPSRSPAAFEVGERREIGVAAGDVLLLRANASGLVNGERVTVKAIKGEKISLTDGRELPRDYRTFSHGYAVTSHAAQGKTVDEVLVVASSQSFPAVSQEQFYVSISRARERARIYTDDAELLGRRVEDTHTRKAAIELEGLREALRLAGFVRQREEEREIRTERERAAERQTQRVTPRVTVEQTVRRVVREFRALRAERLAPVERVAQSFRQWLGQRLGMEQRVTAREFIAQAQREAQSQRQSQSRGIRI